MTTFIVACVAMLLAALAFIAWPFVKAARAGMTPHKGYVALAALVILIPMVTTALYTKLGRANWQEELQNSTQSRPNANAPEVKAMVAKLEQKLNAAPNDMAGWLMLGRSYMALQQAPQALDAYQKAYDLSNGSNTDAAMGLGEAMIVVDERAISGRAGQLFESVLAREPDNPKALWYGAVSALTAGNLPRAHERLQRMLVLGPPENIRAIIERQLQDIEQQLKATGQSLPKAGAKLEPKSATANLPPSQRALLVQVSLAPELNMHLDKQTLLFILARDLAAPGPPLAAVRRAVGDLPLVVTLTERDAMMQGHGISSVARVQVVARISKSGTPQAQAGDLYGDATVEFAGDTATKVTIVINQVAK